MFEEFGHILIDSILDKIREGSIGFPYKKHNISETKLDELIKNVKNFTTSTLKE